MIAAPAWLVLGVLSGVAAPDSAPASGPAAAAQAAPAAEPGGPASAEQPVQAWVERGGLLLGVSGSVLGTYMKLDLPQDALPPGVTNPGRVSGAGYGGELLLSVLYSGRNSSSAILRRLGVAASAGVDGGQVRLKLDTTPLAAEAFYDNYEFPLRAGLSLDMLTFDPDNLLSFLGSGVSLSVLYRRTYNISQVRFKTVLGPGPEAGRALFFDQSTKGLTGSAFEFELLFSSPRAKLAEDLKKPSFKVSFFVLPTNPFILSGGLGLTRYF